MTRGDGAAATKRPITQKRPAGYVQVLLPDGTTVWMTLRQFILRVAREMEEEEKTTTTVKQEE